MPDQSTVRKHRGDYEPSTTVFRDTRPITDPATEHWAVIQRFPDYEISSFGRVRRRFDQRGSGSYKAGTLKIPSHNNEGYFQVWLHADGVKRMLCVHKLVAETFIGDIPKGWVANHKDGVRGNNVATNLEVITKQQDRLHALVRNHGAPIGEGAWNSVLTDDAVRDMRERYKRLPETWTKLRRHRVLGEEFGVHYTTARLVITRKTWKHIP